MRNATPRSILITGASGAIGGALARVYAGPGVTLVLQGRHSQRLEALERHCEEQGARVFTQALDLRDPGRVKGWLEELDSRIPLDLVIVNAGLNTHVDPGIDGEPWDDVQALIDTNLRASLATVHGVLPGMRRRGQGQIALMSSLAGYFGLPMTPTYCATKAGPKAYGEGLRGWLAPEGIRVSVVMPGYVESPMCRGMPGPKPLLWTPERAARVIRRGLDRDRARISFPFPLNLGTWFLAVLPAGVSLWLLHLMGYRA